MFPLMIFYDTTAAIFDQTKNQELQLQSPHKGS